MEKREYHYGFEMSSAKGTTTHDTQYSQIQSLPRVGDEVTDIVKFDDRTETVLVHARVKEVEFDQVFGVVRIYARVLHTEKTVQHTI